MTRHTKRKMKTTRVPETRWGKIKHALHRAEHYALGKAAALGHAAYYGLVAKEAHGSYRYAAAALLIFMVLEYLSGNGEEEGE